MHTTKQPSDGSAAVSEGARAMGHRSWAVRVERYGLDTIREQARGWGRMRGNPKPKVTLSPPVEETKG